MRKAKIYNNWSKVLTTIIFCIWIIYLVLVWVLPPEAMWSLKAMACLTALVFVIFVILWVDESDEMIKFEGENRSTLTFGLDGYLMGNYPYFTTANEFTKVAREFLTNRYIPFNFIDLKLQYYNKAFSYIERIIESPSHTEEKRDILRNLAVVKEAQNTYYDPLDRELYIRYTDMLENFIRGKYQQSWINYAKAHPNDEIIQDEVGKVVGFGKLKEALEKEKVM